MNPLKVRTRRGKRVYIIDFFYPDTAGVEQRYRRDARIQIKPAAEVEARRLYTEAVRTGRVPGHGGDAAGPVKTRWTLGEAIEFWRANTVVKHTTRRGYDVNLEAHLIPRFRNREADSISYVDVTSLRADLADREISTVNNVEIALRAILRFGVDNGKLSQMPKLPELRQVPKRAVRPPRIEDVLTLITAAYAAAKLAIALAAFAGLRAGEIRGLRYRDVDLGLRIITVARAICRGVTDVPKSGHERQIPIADVLHELLEEAFKRQHKPDDLICVSSKGTQWAECSLLHAFRAVLTKVKLPAARIHDLRHFFITECFRAGAPAPDVQRAAGHLHLHVTQRYAHTDEESQRASIAKFSARIDSVRLQRHKMEVARKPPMARRKVRASHEHRRGQEKETNRNGARRSAPLKER